MACKKKELMDAAMKLLALNEQSAHAAREYADAQGLTPRQLQYLQVIDHYDQVTFSQLARCTANSKPTISELINKFLDWDCVVRERSPEDKRVFYIRLTSKGRQLARAQEESGYRLMERIEGSLSSEEINLLIHLLKKIN